MAELENKYLVETLDSRQLLALLFVCECRRKKILDRLSFDGSRKPGEWTEFVDRFAARLSKLPESERTYLIGSHLQSAEEVDIYSNESLHMLLEANQDLFEILVRELQADTRFA